jgi:serine/threonine-protein kinase
MPKTIRGQGALTKADDGGEAAETAQTFVDGAPPPSKEVGLGVGTVLKEKYELVKPLAAGAMGTVYEARHVALQRRFAVKVLTIDSHQQADALPRFKREAELSSALGHENIVDVIDIDRTDDDQWFIVMELLEGEVLRELMYRSGKLPLREVVALARQLGSAVDAAHARGIVHRDLKPENIFVLERKDPTADEEIKVKVLDFGISKVRNADTALTRPGEVIGTPFYMAPEQARGDRTIDHRADLFALGAVFYEALTGTAPFQGATPNAVLRSILLDDLPSPRERNPELPEAVCEVLEKALAKDPDDRYRSGAELAQALAAAAGMAEPHRSSAPEPRPEPELAPTPPAPAQQPVTGFRTIHLVLAFVAGVIVCAGILLLALMTR